MTINLDLAWMVILISQMRPNARQLVERLGSQTLYLVYRHRVVNYTDSSEPIIYVAIAENAPAGQFMPTGVLTEDADASGPSMTLTDVTGEWKPGLTAVNETEVTEHAPCSADDIQFLSSKPETVTGTVNSWGAANWKLTKDLGGFDTNDKSRPPQSNCRTLILSKVRQPSRSKTTLSIQ